LFIIAINRRHVRSKVNPNQPVQRLILLDAETSAGNAILIVSQFLISLECARIVPIFFFLRGGLIFCLFLILFIAGHNPFRAILIVAQPFVNRNRLLVIFGFLQRNGLLIVFCPFLLSFFRRFPLYLFSLFIFGLSLIVFFLSVRIADGIQCGKNLLSVAKLSGFHQFLALLERSKIGRVGFFSFHNQIAGYLFHEGRFQGC